MSSSNNQSTKNQTSTLQSVVDSVTGTVQSAYGALTGSSTDQQAGQQKQSDAAAERDLSHASARAGPFTLSSSGAVAQDDPDRTQGRWDQTVGSGKEMLGNLVGSESLRQAGAQQHADGQAQEAQGQVRDLGQGVADRLRGTVGGAVAGVLGDDEERDRRQRQHDEGKTRQRGVEEELQKRAAAEAQVKRDNQAPQQY